MNSRNPLSIPTNVPFNVPQLPPLVQNNQWRLDELNARLSSRIYPDLVIPQSITPRSVETRQTILGKSTDPRTNAVEMNIYPVANSSIRDNFISGDTGEPNWFLANIDTETVLRNHCFALQKGGVAPQATYIPASNSELYKTTLPFNTNVVEQPFPHLFEKTQFRENGRNPVKGVNTSDDRNKYIMDTYQQSLYRNGTGIGQHRPEQRVFSNVDRASLAKPFYG